MSVRFRFPAQLFSEFGGIGRHDGFISLYRLLHRKIAVDMRFIECLGSVTLEVRVL